jgi:DNA-directed RNA polymerase specialized sigma24 family protein
VSDEVTSLSEFLRLFDPDPEQATAKYTALRSRLIKFFEWRNCDSPEDLAQETLVRGLTRVSEGADIFGPDAVAYFFGIARNVVREQRRPRPLEFIGDLDELTSGASLAAHGVDAQIQLEQCLRRLPPPERELLVRFATEDHHTLSRETGMTPNALRVKVHRIRKKLMTLITSTGEAS